MGYTSCIWLLKRYHENSDTMLVSWYHASCSIIDIITCIDQRENVHIIDKMDLKH
jgi:hypothetical protein